MGTWPWELSSRQCTTGVQHSQSGWGWDSFQIPLLRRCHSWQWTGTVETVSANGSKGATYQCWTLSTPHVNQELATWAGMKPQCTEWMNQHRNVDSLGTWEPAILVFSSRNDKTQSRGMTLTNLSSWSWMPDWLLRMKQCIWVFSPCDQWSLLVPCQRTYGWTERCRCGRPSCCWDALLSTTLQHSWCDWSADALVSDEGATEDQDASLSHSVVRQAAQAAEKSSCSVTHELGCMWCCVGACEKFWK